MMWIRNLGVVLLFPFLVLWYARYWFKRVVEDWRGKPIPDADIIGFTDRYFYEPGERVMFFISSSQEGFIHIQRCTSPYEVEEIQRLTFSAKVQSRNDAQSSEGCDWELGPQILLDERYGQGYYRAQLQVGCELRSEITFMVGNTRPDAKLALIAPVTTWVAYNEWGGKSLYKNYVDAENVHFVSTKRPNVALQYNPKENVHDMPVEINAFLWFAQETEVNLIPDYYLEKEGILDQTQLAVLSYHAEYVSKAMYQTLSKFVRRKGSFLNLGANQLFWKVRWHDDFTRLECRKDVTFFKGRFQVGGMWRHGLRPEGAFLGAHFSDPGLGTYAPYRVKEPSHWLFEGTGVKKGQLFGHRGINELGICGDETDSLFKFASGTHVLAKGCNPADGELYENYDGSSKWDGKGGGVLAIREEEDSAVLTTGSIQSASGLGSDRVFTQMIRNFLNRYLGT